MGLARIVAAFVFSLMRSQNVRLSPGLAGALSVRTSVPAAFAIVIVTLSLLALSFGRALDPVVERRALRRILPRDDVVHLGERIGDRAEAILIARLEQRDCLARDRRRPLLERREIIEDVEAAAVRRDDEIVKVRLHREPVHRRVRQIVLQRLPLRPIVERHVERVLGAEVEKPACAPDPRG